MAVYEIEVKIQPLAALQLFEPTTNNQKFKT
jgi:hypothetical protein